MLNLADPRGNSIHRSDPDLTDTVDWGNDATCFDLARAAGVGFAFGTRLAALDRLATTLRVAGGGRVAALGGAGSGGAKLRAICFGFGAVDLGGNGDGSGALGGAGTAFAAAGFAILRGWTAAILGGGGGAMGLGILPIDSGGGDANVLGFLTTGGCFLSGARRTTLFLGVRLACLTVFRAGLRLARHFEAVGGVRTRFLVRTLLLDFEITGNLGRPR